MATGAAVALLLLLSVFTWRCICTATGSAGAPQFAPNLCATVYIVGDLTRGSTP